MGHGRTRRAVEEGILCTGNRYVDDPTFDGGRGHIDEPKPIIRAATGYLDLFCLSADVSPYLPRPLAIFRELIDAHLSVVQLRLDDHEARELVPLHHAVPIDVNLASKNNKSGNKAGQVSIKGYSARS